MHCRSDPSCYVPGLLQLLRPLHSPRGTFVEVQQPKLRVGSSKISPSASKDRIPHRPVRAQLALAARFSIERHPLRLAPHLLLERDLQTIAVRELRPL